MLYLFCIAKISRERRTELILMRGVGISAFRSAPFLKVEMDSRLFVPYHIHISCQGFLRYIQGRIRIHTYIHTFRRGESLGLGESERF
jgi:hypothetical protein